MKQLPIDVSSFSIMRDKDYVYVDKTEQIYSLALQGRYYCLSRPRRFGKSLLVSTLKELFSGKKALFNDLWITKNADYAWPVHPIISLDFSQIPHHSAQQLYKALNDRLREIAQEQNIVIELKDSPEETLRVLIKEMAKQNTVVILIDEYDKPILDNIGNLQEAIAQREILKSFYTVIKGMDEYLRFVLLTGVTRFARTSIFSGLNNLNDISMKPEAASLLGYTDQEIDYYFSDYISDFAKKINVPVVTLRDQMRKWYNGYRFSEKPMKVYNPFSTLYCLKDNKFANYWIKAGTPAFLIELIKKQPEALEDIQEIELKDSNLDVLNIEKIQIIAMLFQAGYYTIRDYNAQTDRYLIGYPNYEVQEAFTEYLMVALTHADDLVVNKTTQQFRDALMRNDLEEFFENLRILFAHIPYNLHIKQERYYHSLFQLLGTMLGVDIQSEVATNKGRIDVVMTSPKYVYIFEIKFNKKPGEAMNQIHQRGYYEKYLNSGKQIVLVEVLFTRTIEDFTIEYQVMSSE